MILDQSNIPRDQQVNALYCALRNPTLRIEAGQLMLGDLALGINQFKELRNFQGTRSENVPVEMMKTLYSSLVKDVNQIYYLAHCEKSDGLMNRPCTAITLDNCETTLAWEIAAQSRDPDAIGTLVSSVASLLSFDQKRAVDEHAQSILGNQPFCRLVLAGLAACGAMPEDANKADIICALCVIACSYTGRYAYAYLACCDNTSAALGILSSSCPLLLPRSLGSLSPLLSQPWL